MAALPGAICVGCKIEDVEFFVSGTSHAQPAKPSASESNSSRAEGGGMVTRGMGPAAGFNESIGGSKE
jgi:hypothetical protein